MIKLAFNAFAIKGNLTGIGHYSHQLAKAILNSHECVVNFFDGNEWSKSLKHKQSSPLSKYKSFIRDYIPNSYQIARMLTQHKFNSGIEGYHVYHEPSCIAYQTDIPTVITVHDLSWIKYPEMHPKSRVLALNANFEKGIKQASFVITDSQYIKQEFIGLFNYPEDRVVPVSLGFDSQLLNQQNKPTEKILDKYTLKHKQFLLVLGTLEPRKNIQVAIQAFSLLPTHIRRLYPLVIVGMKGWLYSDIEKTLQKMADNHEIVIMGYLPQEELSVMLSSAKALVFPSIYEGFGLPPLEAMACGTPVIGSNVSSIPEVIGDAGLLMDPHDINGFKDSMMRLIEDNDLYFDLTTKSIQRSKLFSWQKCATETIDVYKKTIHLSH